MYEYTIGISLTANVEVRAESYDVAIELVQQSLNLESLDNRVSMPSVDGITVDCIESNDDPIQEF